MATPLPTTAPLKAQPARARIRVPWANLAYAAAAGVLWFLACPDFDVWVLAWVAMVPTLVAIERAATWRGAFVYAWVTGIVGNAGGFYWIAGTLTRFADAPPILAALAVLLLCAWQALTFAGFGAATWLIRRRADLPLAAVAPLTMVTCELLLPMLFPFNVAITQAWQLHVIQIADLTGPLGVTALLLMVNGAVYDLLNRGRRRVGAAVAAGLILLGALAYGQVRIGQAEDRRAAAPVVRVGIVQPDVPFNSKGIDRPSAAAAQLRDLHVQSRALELEGAQLIIWPESAYPYLLPRAAEHDARMRSQLMLRWGFTAPLVFGAITDPGPGGARPDGEPARQRNSVLTLDRDGTFGGIYDKIFLVPFSEHVPGGGNLPVIGRWLPDGAGGIEPGERIAALPVRLAGGREFRIGPMVCFEDTLPAFGRMLAAERPHLLVNVTNDAWFGDTSEPWEHLALSVFRAVEVRTELIRATNTGVSAHVDAAGRVREHTGVVDPLLHPRGPERLLAHVALMEGGGTLYASAGDVFGYSCAALTLVLAVAAWLQRGRTDRLSSRRQARWNAPA